MTYTANSPILAPPLAGNSQAIGTLRAHANGGYSYDDVAAIVDRYFSIAIGVGVDPILAIAQMCHETGYMSSWWSQRPRRNPAGIGCDGAKDAHQGDGKPGAFNPASGHWEHGLSFATWADDAIPAQIGRLLAFALPVDTGTEAQRNQITKALAYRPFPVVARGSAPTLRQLGRFHNRSGIGWADPGRDYGAKIAAIANRILGLSVAE